MMLGLTFLILCAQMEIYSSPSTSTEAEDLFVSHKQSVRASSVLELEDAMFSYIYHPEWTQIPAGKWQSLYLFFTELLL